MAELNKQRVRQGKQLFIEVLPLGQYILSLAKALATMLNRYEIALSGTQDGESNEVVSAIGITADLF
ncbi:MAG: hypothetical protein KJ556_15230 [Gammaproteobacteria bacterium]|nr:hypothetical protein [Gammaproteobacteria bacterium]MBU2176466.1 hypothetical protein [Gammaproteobacteria bacterium]MBU2345545.1 hypothetical protein [Gammaproteobacteria bacterium]MBU2392617.1 hypothetical protein [Gammaproteobacteria bacterium]MBU2684420.1 hypothetical protein [Gammaproteobacteria bacterium]